MSCHQSATFHGIAMSAKCASVSNCPSRARRCSCSCRSISSTCAASMASVHSGTTMAGDSAPTSAGPVASDTSTSIPCTVSRRHQRRIHASAIVPHRKCAMSADDNTSHATASGTSARVNADRQFQRGVVDCAPIAVVGDDVTSESASGEAATTKASLAAAVVAVGRDATRYATAGTTIDSSTASVQTCRTGTRPASNVCSATTAASDSPSAHNTQ
jgi:hypothetical protein